MFSAVQHWNNLLKQFPLRNMSVELLAWTVPTTYRWFGLQLGIWDEWLHQEPWPQSYGCYWRGGIQVWKSASLHCSSSFKFWMHAISVAVKTGGCAVLKILYPVPAFRHQTDEGEQASYICCGIQAQSGYWLELWFFIGRRATWASQHPGWIMVWRVWISWPTHGCPTLTLRHCTSTRTTGSLTPTTTTLILPRANSSLCSHCCTLPLNFNSIQAIQSIPPKIWIKFQSLYYQSSAESEGLRWAHFGHSETVVLSCLVAFALIICFLHCTKCGLG